MNEAKRLCLIPPIRLYHRTRLLLEGSTSHRIVEGYLPAVGHGWQKHEERRLGDQLAAAVALVLDAARPLLAAAIAIVWGVACPILVVGIANVPGAARWLVTGHRQVQKYEATPCQDAEDSLQGALHHGSERSFLTPYPCSTGLPPISIYHGRRSSALQCVSTTEEALRNPSCPNLLFSASYRYTTIKELV